jgi:hypothetical protein
MKYYYKISDKKFEMIPMPELYRMMNDNDVEYFPSMLALYRRILLKKSCALNTKSSDNDILTVKRLAVRVRKLEMFLDRIARENQAA